MILMYLKYDPNGEAADLDYEDYDGSFDSVFAEVYQHGDQEGQSAGLLLPTLRRSQPPVLLRRKKVRPMIGTGTTWSRMN